MPGGGPVPAVPFYPALRIANAHAAPASQRRAVSREPLSAVALLALYAVVCAVRQPGPEPVRDEPALLAAAERLLHGEPAAPGPEPDQRAWLWHGPGLVALLAPLVALDLPLTVIRFLGPLLLAGAVVLFHRVLRARLAPRAALLWTAALALYVPFAATLGTVQKEPLAIALVAAAMLALARGLESGRPRALVAAGVALAALAMVRLEYGVVALALLALAAAWWAIRRPPAAARLAAVAAVAVVACLPWLAYTHHLSGQALYWGSSAGLSLFWMSPTLPGETGQWHSPVRVYRDPALAAYRPLFHRLDRVHPLRSDLELRRRAVANVRARPGVYARNLAANVSRLFFSVPARSSRSAVELGSLLAFNGALVLGVAWAAPALLRRRGSHALPPETVPFALLAVLAIAVHVPPSASPRMLLPIVPLLVWLVAQAAAARSQACRRSANRRR
jgi:4-amino-4-deoxy-L-arabinose transferase-like glycosyltransferase